MATTKKKISKIDEGEARINFFYSCGSLKQSGDTARLAQIKKAYPAEYAEWEKRQARLEKALQSRKK